MNRGTLLEKGFCWGHKGIQGFIHSGKKENLTPGLLKVSAWGRETVIKVEIWTLKPNHPGPRASSATHSQAVPLCFGPTVSLGVLICKLQRTEVSDGIPERSGMMDAKSAAHSRSLVSQSCYIGRMVYPQKRGPLPTTRELEPYLERGSWQI